MADKNMGLYIHIPFCNKKCDYCDFVSYSMDKKAQQQYFEALFCEIDEVKDKYINKTFDSIFIGGGTPSIVYEGFVVSLARKLYSSFHFAEDTEFTIEVNPNSFTKERLFEYIGAGVNRISMGIQCLNSSVLERNGRHQTKQDVNNAFQLLRESEFLNVNGDVMVGLPHQSETDVLDTVKFLIKNKIKHISLYGLQIEEGTKLYERIKAGKARPMQDEKIVKIYNKVYELLKKNEYVRYEVSNFAKPGFESVHNRKYWNETEYLGLGVAAHSFIGGYRYSNTKRLDKYIEAGKENRSPILSREYLTREERRTERIMLSLRTSTGLDLEKYKEDFDEDFLKRRADKIKRLQDIGKIEIVDGFLRVTESGFYVSNAIIVELL